MEPDDKWNIFAEAHLLAGNVLDGLVLLTKRADAVYSYGRLTDLDKQYHSQFIAIFNSTNEEEEASLCQKGFLLKTIKDAQPVKYIIYSKTFCSVYSTSCNNRSGVLVCNVPYGVLVATYSFPHTSVEAVGVIEEACRLLRV